MKLDAGLSLQQEVGWERSTIRAARLLASCQDSPFLVSCPGVLPERLARWKESFPLVAPSVSASCSLPSLDLQELGLPLTFTRKQELASSLTSSTSTLANSLALASALKAAREMGVDRVTCHSMDQLHKIKKFHPDARVLLELALPCQPTGDSLSSLEAGGAAPEQVSCLLAEARRLAIQVTGVVLPLLLSGQEEELPLLREAVLSARHAVELAALQGGALTEVQLGRLCLAGTAPSPTFLRGVAAALAPVAGLALQGDATHWLAAPTLTLAARVIAVRTRKDPALPIQYYINEGVFGAFSSVLGGECVAAPLPLGGGSRRPGLTSGLLGAELVGPSGDELDVVARDVMLPRVQEGDRKSVV